jgi:hypothetical protein
MSDAKLQADPDAASWLLESVPILMERCRQIIAERDAAWAELHRLDGRPDPNMKCLPCLSGDMPVGGVHRIEGSSSCWICTYPPHRDRRG